MSFEGDNLDLNDLEDSDEEMRPVEPEESKFSAEKLDPNNLSEEEAEEIVKNQPIMPSINYSSASKNPVFQTEIQKISTKVIRILHKHSFCIVCGINVQ